MSKAYPTDIPMQTINLNQLRAAVAAGGVMTATLRGHGAAFYLVVQTRSGDELTLVAAKARSGVPPHPREFVDPRKAIMLLRDLGIRRLQVDATQWAPDQVDLRRRRPDRAAALRAVHTAARPPEDTSPPVGVP